MNQIIISIALNILYVVHNTEEIRHAYKWKHNLKPKNQVTLFTITDAKKCYYLAVKSLSALLKRIKSKHDGDFYYLNCFYSFSTKDKLKKYENLCKNCDYCHTEMPKENDKILKYNHVEKSMKVPFVIYADLEILLEKLDTCRNNPKKVVNN